MVELRDESGVTVFKGTITNGGGSQPGIRGPYIVTAAAFAAAWDVDHADVLLGLALSAGDILEDVAVFPTVTWDNPNSTLLMIVANGDLVVGDGLFLFDQTVGTGTFGPQGANFASLRGQAVSDGQNGVLPVPVLQPAPLAARYAGDNPPLTGEVAIYVWARTPEAP